MKRNYKAVIFDLDGVICNTDQYHYQAWKAIADELGISFDQCSNERLKGISRSESLEIILESYPKKLSQEDKNIYAEKKNSIYHKLLENMTPKDVSREVRDTMECLKKRGIKLALGSSSKNAKFILKKISLDNYFDAVSDGSIITHSKPHPEVFLKASEALDTAPELCLVVEDAKSGIEAAKAANMDCAAIGDVVKYKLADYSLTSFSDLLKIV